MTSYTLLTCAHFNMAVADYQLRVFSQAEITKSSSFWWNMYLYPCNSKWSIRHVFSYSPMWDHWSTTLTGWMIWYSAWMGETVSGEWEIWFCFQWNIGGNYKTQKLLLNKKGNWNKIAERLSVRLMIMQVWQALVGTEIVLVYVCL